MRSCAKSGRADTAPTDPTDPTTDPTDPATDPATEPATAPAATEVLSVEVMPGGSLVATAQRNWQASVGQEAAGMLQAPGGSARPSHDCGAATCREGGGVRI